MTWRLTWRSTTERIPPPLRTDRVSTVWCGPSNHAVTCYLRREPSLRWSSERITRLGDAVHATPPYVAQGAAMAIEDAAVLARALHEPLPDGIAPPLHARLCRLCCPC